MRFEMMRWFTLLWLIPIFAIFLLWRFLVFKKVGAVFADVAMLKRIAPLHKTRRLVIRYAFSLVAVMLLSIAMLRPQWGYRWEDVERKGVDIVIAIDLSDSMLAEDVSPTRLERARRKISDLLQILDGDRVGLVAFAGAAIIQSPLTLDYGAIDLFLKSLDTDSVPVKGTSLAEAIRKSTRSFEMAESTSRALLLITDGEELDEGAVEAAQEAKTKGIRIYSIGVGTEKGAPIPNKNGGGFRKNPNGEIVFSKLNEEKLSRLASITGGAFVRSVSDDADLINIYRSEIRNDIEAKTVRSARVQKFEERYQWPLAAAIAFMIAEFLVWTSVGRKIIPWKNASMLALLFAGSLGASLNFRAHAVPFTSQRFEGEKNYKAQKYPEAAKAFEGAIVKTPESAETQFNLGNAYYKAGEFAKAQEAWKSAAQGASDAKLKQEAIYNSGNAFYRLGKLEEAVEAYRSAKELDPTNREAAHNLELTLAELKKRKEQQQQQQQKPKEQKDQEKQKEKQAQQLAQEAKNQERQKNDAKNDGEKRSQEKGRDFAKSEQNKLSKEEAQRLLNALNDEKRKPETEKRAPRSNSETLYDW